jgi:hypothetical protein
MVDAIDPFATPNSNRPPTADMPLPDADAAPVEANPNRPPDAQPAPEKETDEQWILRFLEENQHLARPRPERPPPPPPSPWDGPPSSWKVPDHLSLRHPKGGYMAMALLSRTMDDLDEVTKGERAATYEEVDKYLGHALIAEGLVPFTYTADEAIWWWKSGGYRVLGSSPEGAPNPPLNTRATDETSTTDDTAPDETLPARGDAPTGSPGGMNFNGTITEGMMIDDVVDPSQAGASVGSPAGRQNPGGMPAVQPAAPSGKAPAVVGPSGNQAAARPTGPAQGAAQPTDIPVSTGTVRTSANNSPNRITDMYLPQKDLILALQNGLLSSVEPDTKPGGGGLNSDAQHAKAGRASQKLVPIKNVDVSADPDAIAFVKAIAPALANARIKGGNEDVEKHLMVEWDSRASRYVVTGVKIIPKRGGSVLDLKPIFPDNIAALGRSKPHAFVIHTHRVGDGYREIPGPGDAGVLKRWLIPNFVVEDNAKNPIIHQVIMTAGQTNPKNGKSKQPKISVVRMLGNGAAQNIPRYDNMPE